MKVVLITLNARRVPVTIKTSTVHFHAKTTTTTSRLPSDAHLMASSLEWELPTMLWKEIAGEILNLMNLLRWLCSVCLILVLKCYTYDDHLDDNTEGYMPQGTAHHLEEVSVSAITFCVLDCSASVFKYSHPQYVLQGILNRPLDF